METKFTVALIVVALAVIVSAFSLSKYSSIPVFQEVTHFPSEESFQSLLEMGTDQKIGLAVPQELVWEVGERAMYTLGIRNTESEARDFYIAVVHERTQGTGYVPAEGELVVTHLSQLPVAPGSVGKLDISLQPVRMPAGTYFYRILVCGSSECKSLGSPEIFATTIFSFTILD